MLKPPRDARQMCIVQWGLPLLSGVCWVMWGRLRPSFPVSATTLFMTCAAVGWVWAFYAGGVSRFARVHGLLAPWVIGGLWLYPLSTALLPALTPVGGAGLDAAAAAVHMLLLAAAGLWHRARAQVLPHTRHLRWDGVDVDLAARTMAPSERSCSGWTPAVCTAVVAIVLFTALRGTLSLPVQAAVAASGMHILAFWLYAGSLGRMFGQALRLSGLERLHPGAPFVHRAVPEMQAWRRRSWLYRIAAAPTAMP